MRRAIVLFNRLNEDRDYEVTGKIGSLIRLVEG